MLRLLNLMSASAAASGPGAPPSGGNNVLLVMADDLRPELGAYGCSYMRTPHLDAFAADPATAVFDHAYVSVAWCSPSRTAILTSRRPDTSMTWSVSPSEYWRDRGGNFTTLPQHFKDLGYLTLGIGKIFHPGAASGGNDVKFSWSEQSLPYSDDGLTCPTAGGGPPSPSPSPPPPRPPGSVLYGCLSDRCVQLADNAGGGTGDPACGGACVPLMPSEWLAVRKTSGLADNNMSLLVVQGAHGGDTGVLKKSERLEKELPPSMLYPVHKGQALPLSRPAVGLGDTYLLVALASSAPQPGHPGPRVAGSVRGGSCMTPGDNQDSALAQCGARTLARLGAAAAVSGEQQQPFFLAVGLHKPHVPWTVPQQWYDLYPLEDIALAPDPTPPLGVPPIAMNSILADAWSSDFVDFGALRANGTVSAAYPYDNSTLDEYWSRRARQAYWAATSFTDSNFGILMQATKTARLYDELVIVFVGDHGFQLGDNDLWSKVTNFEHAVRVPLLIRAPRTGAGGRVAALVETLDIFPTVVDLATKGAVGAGSGVGAAPATALSAAARRTPVDRPLAACPPGLNASRAVRLCTDGVSLVPLLRAPATAPEAHAGAYSQVPRGNASRGMPGGSCAASPTQSCESYMGYTVRTLGWRYTEWHEFDRDRGVVPGWFTVPPIAVELYRHDAERNVLVTDGVAVAGHRGSGTLPSAGLANSANANCTWAYEKHNLATDPRYASQRKQLAALLCQGQSLDSCPRPETAAHTPKI